MTDNTQAAPRHIYIHLVSDATGSTLHGVADACLSQFDGIDAEERFWPLIRSEKQLERVAEDLRDHPGPVLYTIVDPDVRAGLHALCAAVGVPCLPVLDPVIAGLEAFLGRPARGVPGLQHVLDDDYFRRMDAVDFVLSYDDGQRIDGIEKADVVLFGVSRTSKTPTCIYLARQGIRAANIPLVPGVPLPDAALNLKGPLCIGLSESPERLVALRRTRLRADGGADGSGDHYHDGNLYLDHDKVEEEIRAARRLFAQQGWPVIDVTRRAVEETAAEIQMLLQKHRAKTGYERTLK